MGKGLLQNIEAECIKYRKQCNTSTKYN